MAEVGMTVKRKVGKRGRSIILYYMDRGGGGGAKRDARSWAEQGWNAMRTGVKVITKKVHFLPLQQQRNKLNGIKSVHIIVLYFAHVIFNCFLNLYSNRKSTPIGQKIIIFGNEVQKICNVLVNIFSQFFRVKVK